MADYPLNFDRIVSLVTAQGVYAHVAMTGGGVATIFAGATHVDTAGDERYAVVAGPGTYGITKPSTGDLAEFYVGPDDEGQSDAFEPLRAGATTDEDVARMIVAAAGSAPDPIPADVLTSLGFDPSMQSMPADAERDRAALRVYVDAANAENHRRHAANTDGLPIGQEWTNACESAGNAAREEWLRTH